MRAQRISHEVPPSDLEPRKPGEQIKPIEADGQLELDLRTAADLDAILIALFD